MNSQPLPKPDKQKSVRLDLQGGADILAIAGVICIL